MKRMTVVDASIRPSEEQLRQDIEYFDRQVQKLGRPSSIWEQGALNCYQVLARQRRKMLADLRTAALAADA